jgi:hypothetical protein
MTLGQYLIFVCVMGAGVAAIVWVAKIAADRHFESFPSTKKRRSDIERRQAALDAKKVIDNAYP